MAHLPECYKENSTDACICSDLRACERRVMKRAETAVLSVHKKEWSKVHECYYCDHCTDWQTQEWPCATAAALDDVRQEYL